MKYKLIHKETGQEYLCDKVTINDFDYYLTDQLPYPNDIVHSSVANSIVRFTDPRHFSEGTYKKVIATNNPSIDLPKVVDEVQRTAILESMGNTVYMDGYRNGYNKSQETHPFSEEDMVEFAVHFHTRRLQHIQETINQSLKVWKEQKSKIVYYE